MLKAPKLNLKIWKFQFRTCNIAKIFSIIELPWVYNSKEFGTNSAKFWFRRTFNGLLSLSIVRTIFGKIVPLKHEDLVTCGYCFAQEPILFYKLRKFYCSHRFVLLFTNHIGFFFASILCMIFQKIIALKQYMLAHCASTPSKSRSSWIGSRCWAASGNLGNFIRIFNLG